MFSKIWKTLVGKRFNASQDIEKITPTDADFTQVIQTYVNRDYDACIRIIMTRFNGAMSHDLVRLYVICIQRMGRTEILNAVESQLLEITASEPWCRALAELILDEAGLDQVLAVAKSNEQRCQAYYYEGATLLTKGEGESAHALFETCSAIEVECLEWHLAGLELFPIAFTEEAVHGGDLHRQQIDGLNKQSNAFHKEGRVEDALALAMQACILAHRYLGANHQRYAESLQNLATVQTTLGHFTKAERHFQQAIDIHRETWGEEHIGFGMCLNNFADLYISTAQYTKAEPLLRQAMEIFRKFVGENHFLYCNNLGNLAKLYQSMGNFVAAESFFQKAVDITYVTYGQTNEHYTTSLNNLAVLYLYMNNFKAALPLLEKVVEIHRTTKETNHPIYVEKLNNLAGAYTGTGNLAAAEKTLLEACRFFHYSSRTDHPTFAVILSSLAKIYLLAGNYTKAESLHQESLRIRRIKLGEDHPAYGQELNNLAYVYAAMGRTAESMRLLEREADIDDRMIGQVFSISSESQRTAYLNIIRGKLNMFLSLVSHHFLNCSDAVQTALSLVLRRKAIEAEALAIQRDAVLGGKYPEVAPKLREISILRAQIVQRTLAGPGNGGLQVHQRLLAEWADQKEKLEAEVARQVPEMNIEQKLRSVDHQIVAMAMPVDMTLIEFVRFYVFDFKAVPVRGEQALKHAHYLAFVMPAGEPNDVKMIDLGEAKPIDQMIGTFREIIMGEGEDRANRGLGKLASSVKCATGGDIGTQLREAIFTPLLKAIGNRKRLLISPDGDLTRLPFEVLPTDDGRRLIDEYQISYLGAGRDVVRFDFKSGRKPARSLVVADPDFDLGAIAIAKEADSRGRRSRDLKRDSLAAFDYLPGTRLEGEHIAAMLDADLWLEQKALDARLKKCQSPHILHLATHGFFLEDQKRDPNEDRMGFGAISFGEDGMERLTGARLENPLLRSGLALAGINTWLEKGELMEEAEDGLLTAEDVTGIDLLDTELVVLSACETGLGEVRVGEGVFGLRRAFVLAGAKTLVMSLWKVPDEQTRELMEDFYRRILGGKSRADALREAQLAMKAKHPEPFYWGAFICQGDPRPLAQLG